MFLTPFFLMSNGKYLYYKNHMKTECHNIPIFDIIISNKHWVSQANGDGFIIMNSFNICLNHNLIESPLYSEKKIRYGSTKKEFTRNNELNIDCESIRLKSKKEIRHRFKWSVGEMRAVEKKLFALCLMDDLEPTQYFTENFLIGRCAANKGQAYYKTLNIICSLK